LGESTERLELEKLRIDAQLRTEQMRQEVRKVVFGTMIVGLAAAFFPFAQQFATQLFAERIEAIKTSAEFERLQEQNRLAESLERAKAAAASTMARRQYLEHLASEARSERIERQIITAEFFSFLSEEEMRPQWIGFRDYLMAKHTRLNTEREELVRSATAAGTSSAARSSALERIDQINRLQNPNAREETPRFNLPLPPSAPGESQLGRAMLSIALREINFGVHEVNQWERVAAYWRAVPNAPTGDLARIPWSAAFVSWVIAESGNLHQLPLSSVTMRIWQAAQAKGFTSLFGSAQPAAGDIVFLARSAEDAERIRSAQRNFFAPATPGIVYATTPESVTVIAGNVWDAVNLVSWSINDPRLVGFVHLPDPSVPSAPGSSGRRTDPLPPQ